MHTFCNSLLCQDAYASIFLFQYSMNPFYKLNTPIKSIGFEKKAQLYGRKYLSS